MDNYAQILNYAIPFFLVLIIIEWAVGKAKSLQVMRSFDTISSISSGVSNITKDVLGLAVVIVSYEWMSTHLAVFEIKSSWMVYVVTFVGLDFAGYWAHRLEHVVNIFWNRHIIHHSSEEFNLACALRQNVSAIFAIFFFLLLPIAVLGVPAEVVAIVAPIHLFAQFWYHTRLIDKLGVLEYILVTPSHHRVHHAINDEYLDRNFSQVFIVWDRLFGTFQEELADVPAVYGVKKQSLTWNPFIINYQHFWLLVTDAWHTKDWLDKVRVFFKPTGWRPADRVAAAPITIVTDPYAQVKYDTAASTPFHVWMWVQLIGTTALTLLLFNRMGELSYLEILLYGAISMLSIFSYTSLMDRSRLAIVGYTGLLGTIVYAFTLSDGWLDLGFTAGIVVSAFFVVSAGIALYFMYAEPLPAYRELDGMQTG